jgi:GxxExxY protein
MSQLLYQDETYALIGACMEVHKYLGQGFSEIVYKDALEIELELLGIPFEREKRYEIMYKGRILKHHYIADFVVFGKIILEAKCCDDILNSHISQTINYLKTSKNEVGYVVNFAKPSLQHKRIIFTKS